MLKKSSSKRLNNNVITTPNDIIKDVSTLNIENVNHHLNNNSFNSNCKEQFNDIQKMTKAIVKFKYTSKK